MRLPFLLLVAAAVSSLAGVQAQGNKKSAARDQPAVLMALPFGVAPGRPARVVLRGQRLENVKEVRLTPKGTAKVLNKGKAAVPNQQDAARVGDSQVEVEITVPADVAGDRVHLVAVSPAGESKAQALLLDRAPLVTEKEPNDGFRTAQSVSLGQTVQGAIERNQDVDVYRFEGKAGQKVAVEVQAARLGSGLDSFLTLYDDAGQVVTTSDDLEDGTDSRIEVTLKKGGAYAVSVADAHDQGGPAHAYRLTVRGR